MRGKTKLDLFTAALAFVWLTLFGYAFINCAALSFDSNVNFWIGRSLFWCTLPIPFFFLLIVFLQSRRSLPNRDLMILAFVVPTVIIFLCASYTLSRSSKIADALVSRDCSQTFRDQVQSYKQAQAALVECGGDKDHTATLPTCPSYQDKLVGTNKRNWNYFQYLELNHDCTGLCTAEDKMLWTRWQRNYRSYGNDACAVAIAVELTTKVGRLCRQLMWYPLLFTILWLVWLCVYRVSLIELFRHKPGSDSLRLRSQFPPVPPPVPPPAPVEPRPQPAAMLPPPPQPPTPPMTLGPSASRQDDKPAVGDKIEALWHADGEWYDATVETDNGDSTWTIKWDDNDQADRVKKASEMRRAPAQLSSVPPGQGHFATVVARGPAPAFNPFATVAPSTGPAPAPPSTAPLPPDSSLPPGLPQSVAFAPTPLPPAQNSLPRAISRSEQALASLPGSMASLPPTPPAGMQSPITPLPPTSPAAVSGSMAALPPTPPAVTPGSITPLPPTPLAAVPGSIASLPPSSPAAVTGSTPSLPLTSSAALPAPAHPPSVALAPALGTTGSMTPASSRGGTSAAPFHVVPGTIGTLPPAPAPATGPAFVADSIASPLASTPPSPLHGRLARAGLGGSVASMPPPSARAGPGAPQIPFQDNPGTPPLAPGLAPVPMPARTASLPPASTPPSPFDGRPPSASVSLVSSRAGQGAPPTGSIPGTIETLPAAVPATSMSPNPSASISPSPSAAQASFPTMASGVSQTHNPFATMAPGSATTTPPQEAPATPKASASARPGTMFHALQQRDREAQP